MARPQGDRVTSVKGWHKTPAGCWSMSLRYHGYQMRILQRGKTYSSIMCGGGQRWVTLRTTDQATAKERAEATLRALATPAAPADTAAVAPSDTPRDTPNSVTKGHEAAAKPDRLDVQVAGAVFSISATGATVEEILDGYRLRPKFREHAASTHSDAHSRCRILKAELGPTSPVRDIDEDTLTAYAQRRLEGGIRYQVALTSRTGRVLPSRERVTGPTNQRSVEADLQLFKAACDWARGKKTITGEPVLDADPFADYVIEEEKNPERPAASHDRFEAMLASARELAAAATDPYHRHTFELFAVALTVLEGTGRRISAVLGLEWEDLIGEPSAEQRIQFRLDLDKENVESTVPLAPHVADALQAYRERRSASLGRFIFPDRSGEQPMKRDNLAHTFREVEAHTKLPPLNGGQFHPYRRKFAAERKHIPPETVMRLMGLRDLKVFFECYARVSEHDMRTALAEPQRLHDTALERSKRGRRRTKRDSSHCARTVITHDATCTRKPNPACRGESCSEMPQ